jgi:hypothetical protein
MHCRWYSGKVLLDGIFIIVGDDVRLLFLWWRCIACQLLFLERVPWWLEIEPPHSGTGCLAEACENGYPFYVGDRGSVFGEGDAAIRIAEYTHT